MCAEVLDIKCDMLPIDDLDSRVSKRIRVSVGQPCRLAAFACASVLTACTCRCYWRLQELCGATPLLVRDFDTTLINYMQFHYTVHQQLDLLDTVQSAAERCEEVGAGWCSLAGVRLAGARLPA